VVSGSLNKSSNKLWMLWIKNGKKGGLAVEVDLYGLCRFALNGLDQPSFKLSKILLNKIEQTKSH
jgi:hypothetical protein